MPKDNLKIGLKRDLDALRPAETNPISKPKILENGSCTIDLTLPTDDEYLNPIEIQDSSEEVSTPKEQIKKKNSYNMRPDWVTSSGNTATFKRRKICQGDGMASKKRIFLENKNYHKYQERLLDPDLDPPAANTLEEVLSTADLEYHQDRLNHMLKREASYLCDPNYMDKQSYLTWQDREKSISWMLAICHHLKLLPTIIHLAVNLLDRYLSMRRVELVDLNRLALATLWIGAKNETTQHPSCNRLLRVSKLTIDKEALVLWEKRVLIVLDFRVTFPNPIQYLNGISIVDKLHLPTKLMSRFLLEALLFDPYFLQFTSSVRSAFSFYISMKVLSRGSWDESFQVASGCPRETLVKNATVMLKKLNETLQARPTPYFTYNNMIPEKVAELATVWIDRLLKKKSA